MFIYYEVSLLDLFIRTLVTESLKLLHFRLPVQRLDILGQLGRTPNHMLQPPQEHLVEKVRDFNQVLLISFSDSFSIYNLKLS